MDGGCVGEFDFIHLVHEELHFHISTKLRRSLAEALAFVAVLWRTTEYQSVDYHTLSGYAFANTRAKPLCRSIA